MFVAVILIVLLVLIGLPLYLYRYRIEGIVALYLGGHLALYLLAHLVGVRIPTIGTGLFVFLTGGLAAVVWLFYRRVDAHLELPKTVTIAQVALVALFALWFVHHMIERGAAAVYYKVEYYKWAYYLESWFLAMVVGFLFPCSAQRVQRFLRALAVLGLGVTGTIVLFYFTGVADVSQWGKHYAFAEGVHGGAYAGLAVISTGALLGGYLIAQDRLTTRRIVFIMAGVLLLTTATILSGTRSSLLIIPVVGLVALGMFRFRYLPIGLGVAAVVAIPVIFFVVPLLPEGAVKRTLTYERISEGLQNRAYLLKRSFDILEYSPAIGKTVGLKPILGAAYSHNFTSQIMVETGLIGFSLYLMAFVGIAIKWARMLVNKRSTLFAIGAPLLLFMTAVFLEAHAHGSLRNNRFWMLLGLIAGHSLRGFETESPQEGLMTEEAQWAVPTTYG